MAIATACDKAFAAAAHVTRHRVDNQRLVPVTLEPRGCVAEFDAGIGAADVPRELAEPGRLAGDAGGSC